MEVLEAKRRFQEAQDAFAAGDFKASLEMLLSLSTTFRELGIAEGLADTLYQAGQVQIKLGQFQDAALHFKEALELYRFFKKERRVAMTLHALGGVHGESGGEDEISWRYYEEALAFYRVLDDGDGSASVVLEMGNLDMKRNQVPEARQEYEEAKTLFETAGNRVGVGKATYMLGVLAAIEGDARASKACMQEASTIFYDEDHLEGSIKVKAFEGLLALHQHRITVAEQHFSECLKLIAERDIREPQQRGMLEKEDDVHVLLYMGELLFRDVKYNIPDLGTSLNFRAYGFFEQAATLARNVSYHTGECKALHAMGLILLERGGDDLHEAVSKFAAALELAKETKDGEMLTRTLFHLGICNALLGDHAEALNNFQDCTLFSRKFRYTKMETRALMEQFKILFHAGRIEEAVDTLGRASEIASSQPELHVIEGEIAILSSNASLETGDVDRARATLEEGRRIFEEINDINGVAKVLHQLAMIEEQQGLFLIALGYLDEIDALCADDRGFEMSMRRIDRCRLKVLAGDIDGAFSMLAREITSLEESGMQDVDVLLAKANMVLYKIFKAKKDPVDADHVLRDLISYYQTREKKDELVDTLLEITREALKAGDGGTVRDAMRTAWQAVTVSSMDPPRVASMLHLLGLVHVQSGDLDLARRYFDEALSYMQKHGMGIESGIIIAQLADLSAIENKPDAKLLYKEALALLSPVNHVDAVMSIKANLSNLLALEGDIAAALDHALGALRLLENTRILREEITFGAGGMDWSFLPARPCNIHALVTGLYVARFVEQNDPLFLERAFITAQFDKVYRDVQRHFDSPALPLHSCKGLEARLDADHQLVARARMLRKQLAFLLQKRERHAASISTNKGRSGEFIKSSLLSLDAKIKEDLASLDKALEEVKKNRTVLMKCKDPGTLVPFLGFNVARHVQSTLVEHPGIVVLDYVIVPSSSRLVIFILYRDAMELVMKDVDTGFYDHLAALQLARQEGDHAAILFEHRALSEFLFPRQLKDRLEELGFVHPVACPDPLLSDVSFNLLGEENDIAFTFTMFTLPDLLLLPRVLEASLGTTPPGEPTGKDVFMFFPDPDDPRVASELHDITAYIDRVEAGKEDGGDDTPFAIATGADATYERFKGFPSLHPAIIHVSGTVFLPASIPSKGFLSMHDRPFFTGEFLNMDLQRNDAMACVSTPDEEPITLDQVFSAWRTLSLSNVPNFIFSSSSHGFSGRFFSLLYDRLRKGDTLAMAYHNCMLYFKNVPEISPLARSHHVLIGNPNWRMTKGG